MLVEPETRLTMCTLEFGTFDRESGQKAFRADHWLHTYGDPLGKEAGPIRAAMRRQGKSLIRVTIDRWGPIATGGFPPDRAPDA